MGKFSLEIKLGQLGMKLKVNGKCLDCGLEIVFLYFDVIVDGRFGSIGKWDVSLGIYSGVVVVVDGVLVTVCLSVLRMCL